MTEPLIRQTPVIGASVAFGTWALGAIIRRRQRLMGGEPDPHLDVEDSEG